MTRRVTIVAIGHILEEIIQFPDRTIGPVVGGPAAYAAVAAARLGADCSVITVVGQDRSPELLAPFADAGVDIRGIAVRGKTRKSILSYEPSGEKRIAYTAIADSIQPSDLPPDLLDADAFLLCPLDFEIDSEVVRLVRAATGAVMLDLGGLGGTVSTRHPVDDQKTATEVRDLVGVADFAKASLEDCGYLLGSSDPVWSAEELVRWGARVALVTCGASGLVHCDSSGSAWMPAFQVQAVDETGAGDVFCGAFLVEAIRSGESREAAAYGAAASAVFVTGTGGVSLARAPDDHQVRRLIATSTSTSSRSDA